MTATDNGDYNISFPKITTSYIERLVRDDNTNELYMPLSSTFVLKTREEMMYVPLDLKNGSTMDALVDSGANVSAIALRELDRNEQQAAANFFKIDDPPTFQIQVAKDQLEKPISKTTLKIDIGDNTFAEHCVVMKNLTRPFMRLHFMRYNSMVIDTTHGLFHSPHLTKQSKNAASEAGAKPLPVLIHNCMTLPSMNQKNNYSTC